MYFMHFFFFFFFLNRVYTIFTTKLIFAFVFKTDLYQIYKYVFLSYDHKFLKDLLEC